MGIYQGIQLVFSHVMQLIGNVSTWFSELDFSVWIDEMPLNFQPVLRVVIPMIIVISIVGLVKKVSFLLG